MHAAKNALDKLLQALTAIAFGALVLVVAWQVLTRLVLNNPSTWSEEFAKYLFVWVSLIAAALVFGERGHIAVTFVVDKMPLGLRKVVAVLIQVGIAVFAVFVLIWGGVGAAQNTWLQNLTALPLQIGHMYIILPIVGVAIIFYAIYNAWEDLRGEGPLTVADTSEHVDDETAAALAKAEAIREREVAEATVGAAGSTAVGAAGAQRDGTGTNVTGTTAATTTSDPDTSVTDAHVTGRSVETERRDDETDIRRTENGEAR